MLKDWAGWFARMPGLLTVSGLAITHVPLASMLQSSLMVDFTDFRTGGNEDTAPVIQSIGEKGTYDMAN